MLKVPFVTSVITLLLLTARTWAECILYTPNIGTGIVNEQPFEVYWVGCVTPILCDFWDQDSNTILTYYDGSDSNVNFTIHNGVGARVYFTLTDSAEAKITSIVYVVKAGFGGGPSPTLSTKQPITTTAANTLPSSSSPTSQATTLSISSPSDTLPTTTDDVLSSRSSYSIPTFSYSTNTQALSSILSELSKAHTTAHTTGGGGGGGGGSQPTNSSNNNNKKSSNTGVIAGATAGGVVALGLIGGLVWFFVSRSRRNPANNGGGESFNQQPASDFGGVPSTPNMSNVHGSYGGASLTSYGNNPTTPYNPAGYNTNVGPGVAPSPIPFNNNNNNFEGAYDPNAYVPSQGGTDNQSQLNPPSLGGPPQQAYGGESFNNPIPESNVPPAGSSLPYNNNAAENWNNVPSTTAQGGYGVQRPGQPYSGAPELS